MRPEAAAWPQAIRGRPARQRGVLGKGLREGFLEENFIARGPELMRGPDGFRSRIFADAVGRERGRMRRESILAWKRS